jgi:transposase InsO family protein
MTIIMNDSHVVSIAQIKSFAKIAKGIEFQGVSRKEKYAWLEEITGRFRYFSLKKNDKTIVKGYMLKLTGFSDAQLTRLIKKKRKTGRITAASGLRRHSFPRIYSPRDAALLSQTDNAHGRLSGKATKHIFTREHEVYGKEEFKAIKHISVSHLYNLRGTRQYTTHARFFTKTSPRNRDIGKRSKPYPEGKPGYLRVDTVHQGDRDKEKGVYHINIVDEITQWEIVGAVEKISEAYLEPLLQRLLNQFPFRIVNFHSDNGSEFINKVIAQLLNKLLIVQTKSRSRHCNDNALVEGKNGSIIRKHIGYMHIPQGYASQVNTFYQEHFNRYLNFHRPCAFGDTITDKKGKQKKVYTTYLTPYQRLKTLKDAKLFLKKKTSFELLDVLSLKQSDNECAKAMQEAKHNLFQIIANH